MNKNKKTIKYILLLIEILSCIVCTFFFGFLIVYGGFFYLVSYTSYTSETPPGLITPLLIFLDIALVIILGVSYFKNFNFKHYKIIRLFLTPIIITAILLLSMVSFFVALRESSDHNQYYKSENVSKREKIKSEKNLEVGKLKEINTFKIELPQNNSPLKSQSGFFHCGSVVIV
jgi:uncharacterized membrane protein